MKDKPITNEEIRKQEIQLQHKLYDTIANAVTSRSTFLNTLLDPRKDMDKECGYPRTEDISTEMYQEMYDRLGTAARVVELFPLESWKVQPEVYEDEDAEEETEFEKAWKALGQKLLQDDGDLGDDEEPWYQDEESNPIWEYLTRADVMSGIGRYGVILLGLNDGKELSEPAKPSANNELLYVRVFPESLAEISTYDSDKTSRRYGRPVTYNVTLSDPDDPTYAGQPGQTVTVHYTRIIHIAETMTSSEFIATPRQQAVFNNLIDVRKVSGGSAEMYWRGAFPGISIETHPQLGGDVTIDNDAIKSAMENYMHGLQRYFALMGMSAKSLAPQVVDPTPQINAQLDLICIRMACPKRIFLGSERGELASSQDERAWNSRLTFRQRNYITPRMIVPFVNRLIWLEVLPKPVSYRVTWPDLEKNTPAEEATIALTRTQAMSAYVAGGVDQLIEPLNYFTRVLGFDDETAQEILEATEDHVAETEEDQLRQMDEGLIPDPRMQNMPPEMGGQGPPKPGQKPQNGEKPQGKKPFPPKE